jgi:hypothetical protein
VGFRRSAARTLALATTLVCVRAHAQDDAPKSPTTTGDNDLPPAEVKTEAPKGIVVPTSVMGGVRAGFALNAGKNAPDSESNPNGAIAGIDLALEGGALVFDHFYAGLIFGGTFFASPQSTTSNVLSVLFGTEFGYLTNPNGLGGYFGLGIAYRAIFVSDSQGNANKFDGPDGLATVALHIRLGDYARLMPRVDFGFGPSGPGNLHAIFVFGVSIWFNDDLLPKRRKH